ncbi:MAG: TrkH family potassium uptake protein [Bacteroidota bacterium]
MNYRFIINILGFLLMLEGFFIALSSIISLIYRESDFWPLIISSSISIFVGFFCWLFNRNITREVGTREGYIVVSIGWILFSVFGAIPFYLSGAIPSYTDAFFETMSGFTTTGASILNDIEAIPHGLLFWRSLTQWLGGMGIIVLSLAILPLLGIGGMQLFVAEVPGIKADKLHPRIKETAKRLWGIYLLFTFSETILLWIGGMTLFDAVNHAFTTMATGGYSTKQASISYWQSPFIHYVITIFMIFAGTNFTLSYFALNRKFKKIWKDEEFRFYIGVILCFTFVVTLVLYLTQSFGIEKSFRDAFFQVVSIITTTGYMTVDYLLWGPFLIIVIFVAMFFGGSAGSTGGGMKIVRILLVLKNSILEMKRLIHPNAVIPVRYNKQTVSVSIMSNILAFIVIYILIFVLGTLIMAGMGLDFESAMGSVVSSLGNIGPGIGTVGPAANFHDIPDAGKWFLSLLMLIGRLEIFTVLIILSPAFWKK